LIAGLLGILPCGAFGDAQPNHAPVALCQTLHESVQPALAGLMKNDGLLETANRAFASGTVDRGALMSVSGSLAQNLSAVRQLLSQKLPEERDPSSRTSADLMKSRLQAVATAQNDALNVIQGYMQAEEMAQTHSQTAVEHQADPNQVGGGFNDDIALHDDFHNVTDPAKPFAETRVGSPARLLQIARSQIGDLEDSAGVAIMSAVKVCNSP
jgi:hypothetical protein